MRYRVRFKPEKRDEFVRLISELRKTFCSTNLTLIRASPGSDPNEFVFFSVSGRAAQRPAG
jgi:hypothetical protein